MPDTTTPSPSRNPPSAVKSHSPSDTALPQIQALPANANTNTNGDQQPGPRRTSFNFLRRQRSSETRSSAHRSASGGKMSKKQRALAQEEALRKQREAAMLPKSPPRLPSHSPLPQIDNFGGEDARPDSLAIVSNQFSHSRPGSTFSRPSGEYNSRMAPTAAVPVPPIPGSSPPNRDFDPYPRAESMTHRGRYSYASSAISSINSPRRVRRRKDPTPFNILVIGTKNSGKSSFIDFLKTALALPAKKRPHTPNPPNTVLPPDSPFSCDFLETEVDNERIGVTLWDSQGLEKDLIDFQLPVIAAFLDSKFEETFAEEQKVVRAPGFRDTHIHCVFLILDPVRLDANISEERKKRKSITSQLYGGLDHDLDIKVLQALQNKTIVIPVISKADSITTAHMAYLKKTVWDSLKRAKLDPLEALTLSESDDEDEDRLDERDEDAYIQSSSDAEGKSEVLDKKVARSSSDAGRSSTSSTSSGPQTSPSSPPSGSKRTHARKASVMSATLEKQQDDEMPFLPLSIISPDPYEPSFVGRKFAWGFADPYNPEHCDFMRLKESVFSEWRAELRETAREQWYEGWRTKRLQNPNKRRVQTSDGLANKGMSIPGVNGRASSAGAGNQYRQPSGRGFGQ